MANLYSLNLFLYHCYIVLLSCACKATNVMSLTAFDHGSAFIMTMVDILNIIHNYLFNNLCCIVQLYYIFHLALPFEEQ